MKDVPAQLVLVHSPLVGPQTWELVAPALAEHGYQVRVPDLSGTVAGGLPYYARQVAAIAGSASGGPAVLVGHSGAGPLLASAGVRLGQLRGYVFVDAGLPTPGLTWMQTVPADLAAQLREMAGADGWLPPWPRWWPDEVFAELLPEAELRQRFAAGCPALPLDMFEEAQPPAPGWQHVPGAYLRLSEAYDEEAAKARALGWPVAELASHHLAPVTDPELVTAALLDLAGPLLG